MSERLQRAAPIAARAITLLLIAATCGTGSYWLPAGASENPSQGESEASLDATWDEACLWEVGSNTERVPAARKRMIAAGERALDWLIPSKLVTKDTLVTRALTVVVTGIGQSASPRLLKALESDNADVRRNAADLLGSLGVVSAAPSIARLLADPDTRMGALSALAALHAEGSVPAIVVLMNSDALERSRVTAAATLGTIGGDTAFRALVEELDAKSAPLRFAAQYALEAGRAVAPLRALIARGADLPLTVKLHAISALGHIGDRAAKEDLERFIDDPSAVVRGFAAEACGSFLSAESDSVNPLRARLAARLQIESDPFARGKLEAALAVENASATR